MPIGIYKHKPHSKETKIKIGEASKIDLIGQKFGRLTVLKDTGKRYKDGNVIWLCICNCGNFIEVKSWSLKNRNTCSCGCLRKENLRKLHKNNKYSYKHGGSETRLYDTWSHMKECCHSPKHKDYKDYGGRGIKVCLEWLDKEKGFINFRDWAKSHGYNDNLEIHRRKHHLGYFPKNCEWLTKSKHGKWHRTFYLLKKRSEKFLEQEKKEKRRLSYQPSK